MEAPERDYLIKLITRALPSLNDDALQVILKATAEPWALAEPPDPQVIRFPAERVSRRDEQGPEA